MSQSQAGRRGSRGSRTASATIGRGACGVGDCWCSAGAATNRACSRGSKRFELQRLGPWVSSGSDADRPGSTAEAESCRAAAGSFRRSARTGECATEKRSTQRRNPSPSKDQGSFARGTPLRRTFQLGCSRHPRNVGYRALMMCQRTASLQTA